MFGAAVEVVTGGVNISTIISILLASIAIGGVVLGIGVAKARIDALAKNADRTQQNADRIPTVEAQVAEMRAVLAGLHGRIDRLTALGAELRGKIEESNRVSDARFAVNDQERGYVRGVLEILQKRAATLEE